MPYQLTPDSSIAGQLASLVEEELDAALASLKADAPDAVAIHDARRRVKRVRAIFRLVERDLGDAGARLTRRLRTAAHALAGLRESDADVETLALLQERWKEVLTGPVVAAAHKGLLARTRAQRSRSGAALSRAREELARVRDRGPKLVARCGTWRIVREGAVRAYRRTRRAMAGLAVDSGSAGFHRWRRRLKDHYYHVRLFEALHAEANRRARTLHRLEEALGDEHNLAALAGRLLAEPRRFGSVRAAALLLGCIASEQYRLRRDALALGEEAFHQAPRQFGGRLATWRRGEGHVPPWNEKERDGA